jgi:hypothetical protein
MSFVVAGKFVRVDLEPCGAVRVFVVTGEGEGYEVPAEVQHSY